MKNGTVTYHQRLRGSLLIAGATAFAIALALLAFPAHAKNARRPPVPADLEVRAGDTVFLRAFAVGTQNYVCLDSVWTPHGPQATLFHPDDKQVITHFLSANPDEAGMLRATWQHSRDTSAVWAVAVVPSSDPAFVEPGAIPWLLLRVVGREDGPTGGRKLTATTFIQRIHTSGGSAPVTGCTDADVGKRALVRYTAEYVFYEGPRHPPGDDE